MLFYEKEPVERRISLVHLEMSNTSSVIDWLLSSHHPIYHLYHDKHHYVVGCSCKYRYVVSYSGVGVQRIGQQLVTPHYQIRQIVGLNNMWNINGWGQSPCTKQEGNIIGHITKHLFHLIGV